MATASNGSGPTPQELVVRIERLLEQLEQLPDAVAREQATATVQAMFDLYGAGLERIAARVDPAVLDAIAGDELVSHLLLLHGLHPLAVEQRVASALDEVRPYLQSHGGEVELLAVEDDAVRLRLRGSCSGCPSSTMTLKLAIENAIHRAAPEIEEVVAEDDGGASGLLQIELTPGPGGSAADGEWAMAGGLPELSAGRLLVKTVAGQPILFLRLEGRVYGYRPACPACEASLAGGSLAGYELHCAGCGSRYDALRAGRCLDSPQLHLEPVPLLVSDDGLVKVALPVSA